MTVTEIAQKIQESTEELDKLEQLSRIGFKNPLTISYGNVAVQVVGMDLRPYINKVKDTISSLAAQIGTGMQHS